MLLKPNYAKQRRQRKAEIKRLDRKFQSTSGDTCKACKRHGQTVKHHLQKRRFQETRWDDDNCLELCYFCHTELHMGQAKFILKYPKLNELITR